MSNKLYSEESIQAIANSIRAKNGTSETYTVSEMSTAISALPTNLTTKTITANGTYNASSDDADGYSSVTVAVEGYAKKSIANTPTPIATFNASALPMPSLKVGIEAVQSGTGDPSPQNVRPFTGWSAVNRYRTGKNLFDTSNLTIYNRYINTANNTWVVTTDGSASVVFYCKPSTTYTLSYDHSEVTIFRTALINKDPSTITEQSVAVTNADGTLSAHNITTSADTVAIIIQANRAVLTSATVKIQVELGTTASTYEAFNGTTYTTQLKDENDQPLTCYGGQLENVNGVQSLENADNAVDMGDLNWTYQSLSDDRNGFTASISDLKEATSVSDLLPAISSCYKPVRYNDRWSNGDMSYFHPTGKTIIVINNDYTDATAFKTAMTGQKIVYELATPQTIPQDSLSIATQDGTNNIWADSGDVLNGEYLEAL